MIVEVNLIAQIRIGGIINFIIQIVTKATINLNDVSACVIVMKSEM